MEKMILRKTPDGLGKTALDVSLRSYETIWPEIIAWRALVISQIRHFRYSEGFINGSSNSSANSL